MNYWEAIVLGLIQGLTEFLPISSSGHLVLAQELLKLRESGIVFELVVHLGTLLSVLIYFRQKIMALLLSLFVRDMAHERRLIFYLIIGTIPAVLAALFLDELFEKDFESPFNTSAELVITGLMLLATGLLRRREMNLNIFRSLFIGIGQALAILPGISRSASTISFGLFTGLKPVTAAEYSFLLSIPAVAGAIVFKWREMLDINPHLTGQYLVGAGVSFLSGLFAVYILLDIIRRGKFKYFGLYCLAIGIFGLIYFGR